MARKEGVAGETLHEIEGAADKMGDWIQSNLGVVVGGIVALLVAVGLASYLARTGEQAEQAASVAFAEAQSEYLSAMGAAPGALAVPELANPETAKRVRSEYRARFDEVAAEHAGTVGGVLARLESAELANASGAPEEALAAYARILEEGTPNGRLRGIVLQRSAQALEAADRFADAAEHHLEAGELSEYPLRHWALADAARCFQTAGDAERALLLYKRLDTDAPEIRLSELQRAMRQELAAMAGEAS